MLTRHDDYAELARSFVWDVPDRYNIGVDVCDRHAGDPARVAREQGHPQRSDALALDGHVGAQGAAGADHSAVADDKVIHGRLPCG